MTAGGASVTTSGLSRRRLIVNLVPLLDVLAILILGMYLQSQLLVRRDLDRKRADLEAQRQRAERAEALAAQREEKITAMAGDLREAGRRAAAGRSERERLEETLRAQAADLESARKQATAEDRARAEARALAAHRRRSEIAESLQAAFGLTEQQLERAQRSIPPGEAEQEKLLSELKRLRDAPPSELPGQLKAASEFGRRNDVLQVHLQSDGTVVVKRPDGTELGRFSDYKTAEDVQTRLNPIIEKADDGSRDALYVLVTWDGQGLLEGRQALARGVGREVDYLQSRPANAGRSYIRVLPRERPAKGAP